MQKLAGTAANIRRAEQILKKVFGKIPVPLSKEKHDDGTIWFEFKDKARGEPEMLVKHGAWIHFSKDEKGELEFAQVYLL